MVWVVNFVESVLVIGESEVDFVVVKVVVERVATVLVVIAVEVDFIVVVVIVVIWEVA